MHPAIRPTEPAHAPQSARAVRFAARLDAALADIPDAAKRRQFLTMQRARWVGLYELFLRQVDDGTYQEPPGDDPPHPVDYLATLAEIETRLGRLA